MTGKTWGPFTGAQLTMLMLDGMATLAVPGSLWAVAASAVSITDAANGHTAAVTSDRRLFVTDTLMEQSVTPGAFFHKSLFGLIGGSTCQIFYVPPSGKAAIVTDVRVSVYTNSSPGASNGVTIHSGTSCSGGPIGDVGPAAVGQYVIPFGPGFGTRTGISVQVFGGIEVWAHADGYLVPAAQVPSPPTT